MKKLLMSLSVLVGLLITGCATSSPSVGVTESTALKEVSGVKNGVKYFKLAEQYNKKRDSVNTLKYLHKACDLNYGKGCYFLGTFYEIGEGTRKDYVKASRYYKKGCDLNNDVACYRLGNLYYQGQGVKKNQLKASKYYKKGCDMNVPASCTFLGTIYMEGGDGVKKDHNKAMKYLKKACSLHDVGGCVMKTLIEK